MLFSLLKDLVFPPVCLLCGQKTSSGTVPICNGCWARATPIDTALCIKCGLPIFSRVQPGFESPYLCFICRKREWSFDTARSGYIFDGPIREAIHMMKYQGHFRMGHWLGCKMVELLADRNYNKGKNKKDLIISVPLSPERLRQREFNQSDVLARSVSKCLGIPFSAWLLERSDGAKPQVGLATRQRWSNVQDQFRVRRPERLMNKQVILVDDVITTGATVNECSRVLKQAGAVGVEVWTLARTMQQF